MARRQTRAGIRIGCHDRVTSAPVSGHSTRNRGDLSAIWNNQPVSFVEVQQVTPLATGTDSSSAFHLDVPEPGGSYPGYSLPLRGWAEGSLEAVHLSLVHPTGRSPLGRLPAHDLANARGVSFEGVLRLLGVPREFEVALGGVVNGRRMPFARLRGRRELLPPPPTTTLDPLLLLSEGRSGTTWFTQLLGHHPRVLAYEPYRLEPRVGNYWAEIVRTLSDPLSYSQTVQPLQLGVHHWWAGEHRSAPLDFSFDPAIGQWLERDAVEALAAFCRERAERFYLKVASEHSKDDPRYFVERCDLPIRSLMRELFPGARTVYLVRDFRDVVCSRIALDDKLGAPRWGRRQVPSDAEWVSVGMRDKVSNLLEAWRQDQDVALLVRYEDLILEPEQTLARLLDYLDLESDQETVAKTLEGARSTKLELQTAHRTKQDEAATIGRWKRDLSPELSAACEEAFAEALSEFGY
jgi:hypothetical protein